MPGLPPGFGSFLRGQILQMPPVPTGDLFGRTYVITGANSGLGLDACKHLMRLGASMLVLGCRSVDKGLAAKKAILDASGSSQCEIIALPIDLANPASIIAFADQCSRLNRVDGFLANAAISVKEFHTIEGDESNLAVNVLGTFLSAILMVPKMRDTATRYHIKPTIAVVGSAVHFFADTRDIRDLPNGGIFRTLSDPSKANMANRYNLSKLLVMMCVQEMAQHLKVSKEMHAAPFVVINNVNPGFCSTNLFREETGNGVKIGLKLIGRSSEEGSRNLVHGVTADESSHGKYLSESRIRPASQFVRSSDGHAFQHRLWNEIMDKLETIWPGVSKII